MKQFTLEDLRALEPCYDPDRYLPENWSGNALDILDVKEAPFPDRLWLLMRTDDFFSEKFIRLYGVWCARQVQHLMQDERSIKAIDVSEAFANGNATEGELAAASSAARDAWGAAWAAARAAAWDSARAAAWTAARAAQEKTLREMIIAGIETGDVK